MSTPATDRSTELLREGQPLEAIFNPKTVAVIGATETANSVGRTVLWNLVSNPFGGTVFPVNLKRPSVLGIKAYPSIKDVPAKVDLAVICTPAGAVPGIMAECVEAGVRGVIVISAGFKELGPSGVELEQRVLAEARRGKIRVIGPNCLGVMNPIGGLNASFAKGMAKPGNVAFISQSGALLTAVLDWSFKEQVGFSGIVSVGSMLDVNWGDLIDYYGNDTKTKAILVYMESIGDARSFLSAAREVALTKPIIVIKPGRTDQAAKAAASHTGSLTGSDEVLETAFRRAGVLRVTNISDLFYMAEVLAKQPRPRGNRLTILTNAGGPGVLATDALIGKGGALTQLSKETHEQLNAFLPPHWSRNNPVDILGDAGADRYAKALAIAAKDDNADGLLVILTPQDMTDPTATAEALRPYAQIEGKPVIASWMGGPDVAAGEAILNRAGIPTFPYPDTAAKAFCYMHRYAQSLKLLYETPALGIEGHQGAHTAAAALIDKVRASGRTILTEIESKQLLAAYDIPIVPTELAANADQAVKLAEAIGYPVVLKIYSETITHKTDVGGVKLNLINAASVREAFTAIQSRVSATDFGGVTVQKMVRLSDAYEVIIGSSLDPQFGPVLLFGSGGQLVEVYKDRALGLPPLNATLARRLMERTAVFTALKGVRGRPPCDLKALEQLLVRFSQLIAEQPWIKEIDINPLLINHEQMLALDARVVVHDLSVTADQLPKLAIRPYPTQYVDTCQLRDGTAVTIRPIRPEDEPLLVQFHQTLSEQSVQFRYFHPIKLAARVEHERLIRVCFSDYDRELPLVAIKDGEVIGVGRLSKIPGHTDAEFGILVSDAYQHQGLGTELLGRIVKVARAEKVTRVTADILSDNTAMQKLSAKLGFTLTRNFEDGIVKAEIDL